MLFIDPLDNNSYEEEQKRSDWYYTPLARAIRKENYSFEEGSSLRTALEVGEWSQDGISTDAWRCLWSGAPHEVKLKAMELDLVPPPSNDLDWFSKRYHRTKTLKGLFLAESKKNEKGEWQTIVNPERIRLADLVAEKYPALIQMLLKDYLLMLREDPEKFWSSPWALAARPEMAEDCNRIIKNDGYGFLIENFEMFTKADYLSLALGREMPLMIEDALRKGASPNDYVLNRRNEKQTVFQTLIYRSDYESVEKMLSTHEADIEKRDQRGLTPFLSAVITHDLKMMDLLKEKGADIHAVDRFGQNGILLLFDKLKVGHKCTSGSKYSPVWEFFVDDEEKVLESLTNVRAVLGKLNDYGLNKDIKAKGYKKSKKNPNPFYDEIGSVRRGRYTAVDGDGWGEIVDKVIQEVSTSIVLKNQVQMLKDWKTDLVLNWNIKKVTNVKPEKDLENAGVKLNLSGFNRF